MVEWILTFIFLGLIGTLIFLMIKVYRPEKKDKLKSQLQDSEDPGDSDIPF